MNLDFVRGSFGGLGSGLIGWGFDTGRYIVLGLGVVCFFGSYLIPLRRGISVPGQGGLKP